MPAPNLFHYATKELSQDAFIAWLLDWGNQSNGEFDKNLNECGKNLISALFAKHNIKLGTEKIASVKVYPQWQRIDVVCLVNNKYAILIEDKIHGTDNTDKLANYVKKFKRSKDFGSVKEKHICPIYFKIHNESNTEYVIDAGFERFTRKDFLIILKGCASGNEIFLNFKTHLLEIEEEYESYKNKALKDWTSLAWMGFYSDMQRLLGDGSWGYSSNPQGGHYVFWWNVIEIMKEHELYKEIYCQIDSTSMRIKSDLKRTNIHLQVRAGTNIDKKEQSKFRTNCYISAKNLYDTKAKQNSLFRIEKPAKFRSGQSMRILCALGEIFIFDGDQINMAKTAKNLQSFASVLFDIQKELL